MWLAFTAFLLSAGIGFFMDCLVPGIGTTMAVPITGAFISYSLNRKK